MAGWGVYDNSSCIASCVVILFTFGFVFGKTVTKKGPPSTPAMLVSYGRTGSSETVAGQGTGERVTVNGIQGIGYNPVLQV